MITVAHVITKLELGGAQENTLYTCANLDRERFRVALLYGPGGILDEDARAMPDTRIIEVAGLERAVNPRADADAIVDLSDHFRALHVEHKRLGFDPRRFIVHTHSSKAGVIGRLAAKAAGAPHVVHSIHGFGFHQGQSRLKFNLFLGAERLAAKVTHAFIGVSRANLAEARARGIIKAHHDVSLVRSGMDLTVFERAASKRRATREALGLVPEDEVLLCIGNFKPQKDPLTLVAAMGLLAAKRPRAVLLFAGDGGLRDEVERAIRLHGVQDRVRLLGWRRDIPELLAASDVVVLSSIFEGLPRSAVQAVAARRPFVGTRVDGTPEIIHDGKNGYLVEPRDPDALAKAMAKALLVRPIDPADIARLADWDADVMVRQQEAIYERLVHRAA